MRAEMLKRLDELIREAVALVPESDPGGVLLVLSDWQVLCAELAAERCEKCRYYQVGYSRLSAQDPDEYYCAGGIPLDYPDESTVLVRPNFCCAHFEKKAKDQG